MGRASQQNNTMTISGEDSEIPRQAKYSTQARDTNLKCLI